MKSTSPLTNPVRKAITARRAECGHVRWSLHLGQGGTQGAIWCPWRAEQEAQISPVNPTPSGRPQLGELRAAWRKSSRINTAGVLVFNPREDIFVFNRSPPADNATRDAGIEVLRAFLAGGDTVSITTRGGLDDASALVELAGIYGRRLQARVGVFGGSADDEARWEPGLAPRSERLRLVAALVAAGAEVEVEVGPIIPFVNDDEKHWRALFRAIARTGATRVVPRFLGGTPALLGQIERELSAGAARMVGGWLSRGPEDGWGKRRPQVRLLSSGPAPVREELARALPLQARQPRLQRMKAAAVGLPIVFGTCACFERGHAHVCFQPRQPRKAAQLSLFDSDAKAG